MSAAPAWRWAGAVRTHLSFPLLTKELLETSARRRTYVLRTIYAAALYGIFMVLLPAGVWSDMDGADSGRMGFGREMFDDLILLQLAGMVLFLPALMCGRIAQEKERDSLVLLFLTELSPWSIVLQKYFGGLLLMLSFFLLGLPLAGVAYAFGGLDSDNVVQSLVGLLATTFAVGALALFCSAWCRSTVGAFMMTYLLGAIIHFVFFAHALGSLFAILFVTVLLTCLFLILSRRCLVSRALVPPVNFLRPFFERLDRTMKRLNRATGGVVVWQDSVDLPSDEPIFWRETHRRVLGKPHYLIRLLFAVEAPTILLCMAIAVFGYSFTGHFTGFTLLLGILAVLEALFISVHAANSIVSERVGQSFDVLRTTPLTGREIVRQKERALRRLLLVAALPLLTVVVSRTYASGDFDINSRSGLNHWLPYFVCGLSMIVIYLPLIAWLSLWISLRVRTRFQATIAAVGTLTAWVALSPALFYLTPGADPDPWSNMPVPSFSLWNLLFILSPASVGYLNEISQLRFYSGLTQSPWPIILINAAFYAALALLIRWRLFADAESLLRR